jgi:hypothetical protein
LFAALPKIPNNTLSLVPDEDLSEIEDYATPDGSRIRLPIDENILEMASFALTQVSPEANEFHGVTEAYSRVVAGVIYDLVLSFVSKDNLHRNVQVSIYEDPGGNLSIV